ncbi:hypothetical protein C6361_01770 [Plantactinospora sp. BC1]|uniref:type I polyketide synthase n=1 Tax=Plantactinospora sp. BC1 TaxID=2108470 RepID=UPI000D15F0C0|nr:type I polyketide synthase [Plantactinospora sp. BC1]AVT28436.1 hypothetical protein C6361_01770 [Plantactinospora sp. BC1]
MSELDIAIIGMAGRFPGAAHVQELWQAVTEGRASATTFTRDELLAAGVPPELADQQGFAPVRGVLADADRFDAAFFGYSPREAEYIDPQQRVFLEVAWNAVEHAGYRPDGFVRPVGVFASCSQNTYLEAVGGRGGGDWTDGLLVGIGNQIDFLSTRVSYKLNLTGPSLTVQTACSSSLVAIHLAVQSLLSGECDFALAGGSAIRFPQVGGQLHTDGGVYSPDGRCMAYTVAARGVFSGNGAAVVVLRRLDDALADGDHVHAVIKASAVNNDGREKIGFSAPSQAGQAAAMRSALELAGVAPGAVGYVEGHGTGTPLGDQIEMAALRSVHEVPGRGARSCAVGSIKSNLGHLDAAAGVTGLIKAALAVRDAVIPPQPHPAEPSPALVDGASPFYLATEAEAWPTPGERVAAVNSLGLGGTNAHVVLAQPPEAPAQHTASTGLAGYFLAPVSATGASALQRQRLAVADDLDAVDHGRFHPADVSATLLAGRSVHRHRAVAIGRDLDELTRALRGPDLTHDEGDSTAQEVVFMYSGGGTQHLGMARELLDTDPVFAAHLAECRSVFAERTGIDLVDDILRRDADFTDPVIGLGATFLLQVAMARTLVERGVRPRRQIGHSLGEYTAAVVGGSLSLPDAVGLVVARAELLRGIEGGMLSVYASEDALRRSGVLHRVSLAAVNAPDICTLSGSRPAIEEVAAQLAAQGVECRMVAIGTPGHSSLLDPILDRFAEVVRGVTFNVPAIGWISNLTGIEITEADLADPGYWVRHLRHTIRFTDGVTTLLDAGMEVFVEIGPSRVLGAFVRATAGGRRVRTVPTMRHADEPVTEGFALARCFAQLFAAGVTVDPALLYGRRWRRVPMRGYRFARTRHWAAPAPALSSGTGVLADPDAWLTAPTLARLPRLRRRPRLAGRSIVLVGAAWPGAEGVRRAAAARGGTVLTLGELAESTGRDGDVQLVVTPGTAAAEAMAVLAAAVAAAGKRPYPSVTVLTAGAFAVGDEQTIGYGPRELIAAVRVFAQEYAGLRWQCVDLAPAGEDADAVLDEIAEPADHTIRVVRGAHRWRQLLTGGACDPVPAVGTAFRQGGSYLFTGGLGRFSLHLAHHLCTRYRARVVLVSRRGAATGLDPSTRAAFDRLRADHAERVEIERCDVTDVAGLTAVVDRHPRIDGIFHAAAATAGASMRVLCDRLTDGDFAEQAAAKLGGAEALARAMTGRDFDFCLSFSSNAVWFGGPGLAAYAAGNAVLEAFAERRWSAGDTRWLTAAWDGWRLPDEPPPAVRTALDALALAPGESVAMVEAIVAGARGPVTVVSKADVTERAARWIRDSASAYATADPPPEPVPGTGTPVMSSEPPADELETTIAGIWHDVLGTSGIGRHDTFFHLGGHSLMGLRMLSRVNETFRVELRYVNLMELDTVAKLADWVRRQRAAKADPGPPPVPVPTRSRTLSELRRLVTETP